MLVISWTGKIDISLSLSAPENLVSRDGFGSPSPRQSAHLRIQAELVLTYGIPPEFRGGWRPFIFLNRNTPSGQSRVYRVACRWRSLTRVHRHRASKPQGSSERVLPWQVTMDQLIFASLSHTHYWYEVGMLKVPAAAQYDSIIGVLPLSDESFPNGGARGAFAKPSRSLQEGSAKPSRSVSSRRLRGASKAPPRTLRGGCTYQRFHEDALEGSRGLLEGSVDELHVPTRS